MLRVVVRVVVTICLTLGILGFCPSDAQAVAQNAVIFNTLFANITQPIQNEQTAFKRTAPNITVFRSPDCSCCGGWIKHLKAQGFEIKDFPTPEIEAVKLRYEVSDNLTSCHTAIINGYVIEGHVPAQDIYRLLQQKPNIVGLTVPQMPVGTPGMEMGNQKDPFTVFTFDTQGRVTVFNEYPSSSGQVSKT